MNDTKGLICIVDDRDDTRDEICLLLESYGWLTTSHASTQGFIEDLDNKQHPDALIFDLDMLDKNRAEIQKTVNDLNKTIPIIMLTVDIDSQLAKQAASIGETVLQKPVNAKELIRVIESLV